MKAVINATVANVREYTNKEGDWGGILNLSTVENKRLETLEFFFKNKKLYKLLESKLQEECEITIDLTFNQKYGFKVMGILSVDGEDVG